MKSSEMHKNTKDNLMASSRLKRPLQGVWSLIKRTFFIIGSASIVFIALRNSLTYHLQQFWGASGNFWQNRWDSILDTIGDDPFTLLITGPFLLSYFIYFTIGFLYIFMDLTGRPKFMRKYKTQPGTNEPLDKWKLIKVLGVIHFNIVVISYAMNASSFYLMQLRGYDNKRELPTFHQALFHLIIFILIEEIGFYYFHRLFHHRLLYKHFHKLHHEWQSPIAISALYAHPLEHVVANLIPIFLGPLLMGSHPATIWLWFAIAIITTLNDHSGYHLPFMPSPEAHDYHHLKFTECYGVLGILDFLHGTDEKFRETKSYSRHLVLLSLTPARKAYPDDNTKLKTKMS